MLIVFNQEKPAKPRLLLVLSGLIFVLTLSAAIWLSLSRSWGEPLPLAPALHVDAGVSLSLPAGWKHKIQNIDNERGTVLTASPPGWTSGLEGEEDPAFSLPGSKIQMGKFNLLIRQNIPGHPAEHLADNLGLDSEDTRQDIHPATLGPLVASSYELRTRTNAWLLRMAVTPSGLELFLIMRCRGHEISSGRIVLEQIARSLQIDLPPAAQAVHEFSTAAGLALTLPSDWLAFYRSQPADLPAAVSPGPLYLQPAATAAPLSRTWQMTAGSTWLDSRQTPEQLLRERVAQQYQWLTPPPCQALPHPNFQIVRLNAADPPGADPAIFWLITPTSTAVSKPAVILESHFPHAQSAAAEEPLKKFVAGLKFRSQDALLAGRDVFSDWLKDYAQTPLAQQTDHPLLLTAPYREWYLVRFDGQPIGYQTNLYRLQSPTTAPTTMSSQPATDSSSLIVESIDHRPRWHTVRQTELNPDRTWSVIENDQILGPPGQGPRSLRLTASQIQPTEPMQIMAYSGRDRVKLETKLASGPELISEPAIDLLFVWLARHGQTHDLVRFRTLGMIPGQFVSWQVRVLPSRQSLSSRNQRQVLELRSNLGFGPSFHELTSDGQLRRVTYGLITVEQSSESEVQSHFSNVPRHLADFMKDMSNP